MTRENIKYYLPLIKAFAEGKTLQCRTTSGCWIDLVNPSFDIDYNQYRIKPIEPTEPQYRPWKSEEVPVGSLLRWKESSKEQFTGSRGFIITMITGIGTMRILTSVNGCNFSHDTCLNHLEHTTDNGKTWLPCGVLVTE